MKEEYTDARTHGCTHTRMDEQTLDGHKAMTIARWPSVSGANNKILDTIKLKAFADDKLNVAEMEDFSL